jgi:hypothetical protein
MPKTSSVNTLCSTANPMIPPIGSVIPEKRDHRNPFHFEPVE